MKTNHVPASPRFSAIEALESRIAPAAVFTFTDVDGDHVTVKTSKGNNTDLANFAHVVNGQLQLLDLSAASLGGEFVGSDVSITATRGPAGDGHVNVGFLDATGVNLGSVTIDGDLGRLHAGHGDAALPALKGLTTLSMGSLGLSTQAAGGSLSTDIKGAVGQIKIAGNLDGADLALSTTGTSLGSIVIGGSVHEGRVEALGNIGSVKIGGEMTSSGPTTGGSIQAGGDIGSIVIGGSVAGSHLGAGEISATNIGSVKIGGSLTGGPGIDSGSVIASGKIGSVTIGGDVIGGGGTLSGSIYSGKSIGTLKITGDLVGGDVSKQSGIVYVTTTLGTLTVAGDVRGGLADDSGAISAIGGAGSIKIGGSLVGGGGGNSGALGFGGTVGSLTIGGDIVGGSKIGAGSISASKMMTAKIGGSLLGGSAQQTGRIFANDLGTLSIGGDVRGGSGDGSGEISLSHAQTVAVHGSLLGGTANNTGVIYSFVIQNLTVDGDIRGGSPAQANQVLDDTGEISGYVLGKVTIGGSVIAGTEGPNSTLNHSGAITAAQQIGDLSIHGSIVGSGNQRAEILVGAPATGALALKSLTVGGAVVNTDVLVGYNHDKMPVSADVQVGAVTAGSWIASSLVAGVQANANNYFGDGNDTLIAGGKANIIASIASITIKGQCLGSAGVGDHYGFVAEKIGSFSTGGEKLPLTAAKDTFALSGDVSIIEV